ncbi:MAG TPA: archaellin/type IV pilin N-terminal domain-containing protein [Methanospirillum sp.]|uniref:archaellin/type IV pilin N-terminal domain-containing protein n=1 Tax=Methanospirillum sp. TaxID=45200 RepID=UPI002C4DFC63|nr:archaellin/type IV pilin N-terminal domain-containing protein [Methanospirillum sp.]HWQ63968.1 archaellin/type IV pilin N-terminal domain-containing protein [Methanospirillum sp.]
MRKDPGFSGLEAAVILIAFVVVAAVFAYVMMSTGFFATQRFQEVTYAGVKQSTSTVITDGLLRGTYSSTNGLVSLSFSLRVPETGEAVDLSDMIYYYVRNNGAGGEIPISCVHPSSGLLYPGGNNRVTLDLTAASMTGPMAGGSFSLEIKPPVGASTLIQRTLPDAYEGGYIS